MQVVVERISRSNGRKKAVIEHINPAACKGFVASSQPCQVGAASTGDFGAMFGALTSNLPKRPQRVIYQTRLQHRRG